MHFSSTCLSLPLSSAVFLSSLSRYSSSLDGSAYFKFPVLFSLNNSLKTFPTPHPNFTYTTNLQTQSFRRFVPQVTTTVPNYESTFLFPYQLPISFSSQTAWSAYSVLTVVWFPSLWAAKNLIICQPHCHRSCPVCRLQIQLKKSWQ